MPHLISTSLFNFKLGENWNRGKVRNPGYKHSHWSVDTLAKFREPKTRDDTSPLICTSGKMDVKR